VNVFVHLVTNAGFLHIHFIGKVIHKKWVKKKQICYIRNILKAMNCKVVVHLCLFINIIKQKYMNFKRNLLQTLFTKTITNQTITVLLLAVFSFFLTNVVLAAVTVPSGTITDPVAQGYATCTPGNCAIATSSSSTSLPSTATLGQVLVWDGTNWVASSSLSTTTTAYQTALNQTSVVGATGTGIFFLDPTTGKISQDVDNFNYDPITKKLTITGGLDPLYLQAKDAATGTGAYFEAFNGASATLSVANSGRLRYSTSTQAWEVSTNGGAYAPIVVNSSNVVFNNATITNATIPISPSLLLTLQT
jgi:hypothetical protein